LNDGRVLVVEYKGAHLSQRRHPRKRSDRAAVGRIERRKCLFLMAVANDNGRDVATQIADKIRRPDSIRPAGRLLRRTGYSVRRRTGNGGDRRPARAEMLTVCLDFDERVMRMGYGEIGAVQLLRMLTSVVRSAPGLRTALVIVDDTGFIFTPTALYLEAEPTGQCGAQRHTHVRRTGGRSPGSTLTGRQGDCRGASQNSRRKKTYRSPAPGCRVGTDR
jgi:hypothetical protein